MSRFDLSRYVTPWKYRRAQLAERIDALRHRDGDRCTRCRRPMRFDLPAGHDLGARIEPVRPGAAGRGQALDNLCLTHGRCNTKSGDDTGEVTHRVRVKAEADLFANARQKRQA